MGKKKNLKNITITGGVYRAKKILIWALDNGDRLASRLGHFNLVTAGLRLAEWGAQFGVANGNRTPGAQSAASYYTLLSCISTNYVMQLTRNKPRLTFSTCYKTNQHQLQAHMNHTSSIW